MKLIKRQSRNQDGGVSATSALSEFGQLASELGAFVGTTPGFSGYSTGMLTKGVIVTGITAGAFATGFVLGNKTCQRAAARIPGDAIHKEALRRCTVEKVKQADQFKLAVLASKPAWPTTRKDKDSAPETVYSWSVIEDAGKEAVRGVNCGSNEARAVLEAYSQCRAILILTAREDFALKNIWRRHPSEASIISPSTLHDRLHSFVLGLRLWEKKDLLADRQPEPQELNYLVATANDMFQFARGVFEELSGEDPPDTSPIYTSLQKLTGTVSCLCPTVTPGEIKMGAPSSSSLTVPPTINDNANTLVTAPAVALADPEIARAHDMAWQRLRQIVIGKPDAEDRLARLTLLENRHLMAQAQSWGPEDIKKFYGAFMNVLEHGMSATVMAEMSKDLGGNAKLLEEAIAEVSA